MQCNTKYSPCMWISTTSLLITILSENVQSFNAMQPDEVFPYACEFQLLPFIFLCLFPVIK